MTRLLVLIGFIIFSVSNASSALSSEAPQTHKEILFIYPVEKGVPFWDSQVDFASAVANALGYKLNVAYPAPKYRNRFEAHNFIKKQIEASELQPVLVLTSFWVGSEEKILTYLSSQGIPLISINSDVTEEQFNSLGRPRERFPLWLAQLSPNDELVGQQLAKALIEQSRERRCFDENCMVNIFGITGLSYSAVSQQRVSGLKQIVSNDESSSLLGTVFGDWSKDRVKGISSNIVMRHEDINALWVASDVMAYGFIEGLKASSLTLPSNTVIGSIDWSQETIEKIKTDALQISLGGHFLEGGQAIVLFHDYINGVDFADELGVVIKTPMSILDRNNVSELGALLEKPHWRADKIKSYSKFLNPSRANYQLNPKALILEQRK